MTIYATYFDSNFLLRGLACLESLVRHSRTPPRILVLALDAPCAEAVARLWPTVGRGAAIEIVPLSALEAAHLELPVATAGRSRIEYYFTLTPVLCAEALARAGDGEAAIYIDADLYFYDDPQIAANGIGDAPITLVEHRFPAALAGLSELYGRFNVGWVGLRACPEAQACIAQWREQCLRWCADRPEPGRFADQKYLDAWPDQVPSLAVLQHPGVNLAPWNLRRHRLAHNNLGHVTVDGAPLVFFHFHQLQRLSASLYEADLRKFGPLGATVQAGIYAPYLRALDHIEDLAYSATKWRPAAGSARLAVSPRSWPHRLVRWPWRALRFFLRHRIIFNHGEALSPWRSLRYT